MDDRYSNNSGGPDMLRLRTHAERAKRRAAVRRTRALLILLVIAIIAVMFLTPFFNIRSVNITGTEKVTSEQTDGISVTVVGQNLFTLNKGKLKENYKTIPYVKDVNIRKRLIPPIVTVEVTECVPMAYVVTAGGFVVIDDNCKILEIAMQPPSGICQIVGVSPKNPVAGQKIDIDETEKSDIIVLCTQNLSRFGNKINSINIADINNISFNYENRLSVICGSSIDFSEKIALFEEAVKSNRLDENARGTMDLTNTGKAVYTP